LAYKTCIEAKNLHTEKTHNGAFPRCPQCVILRFYLTSKAIREDKSNAYSSVWQKIVQVFFASMKKTLKIDEMFGNNKITFLMGIFFE